MNTSPLNLLNAHLDGKELAEDEAALLSEWVKADPANARTVVELGFIHSQADYLLSIPQYLEELSDSRKSEMLSELQSLDQAGKRLEPFEANPPHLGQAEKRQAKKDQTSQRKSTGSRWTSVLAIAAGMLGVAAGATYLASLSAVGQPDPEVALARSNAPDEIAPAIPLEPVLATVTECFDVEWRRNDLPRRGLHLRRSETIVVDHGILALTTSAGCEVVVQAPATVRFDDENSIYLAKGKLAARVEGIPAGLTIQTPTATVVDLGTEFGVGVGGDDETFVAVYDGVVQLTGLQEDRGYPSQAKRITAGRAGYVASNGAVRWLVETIPHEREFIRPEEIESLRQARAGSKEAQQQLDFYTIQRTRGLLGFQSFDIPSGGAQYSLAFKQQPVRSSQSLSFAGDLLESHAYSSGALVVEEGQAAFLDLDTSPDSPLARAGLLTKRGHVGRTGTQLWFAWKTQSLDPERPGENAGVSLMFGDNRQLQEPLFLGVTGDSNDLAVVSNVGSRATRYAFDTDADGFAIKPRQLTGGVHQWVARFDFEERADKISVWCDTPLGELASTRPQVEVNNASVMFDRLHLGVGRGGAAWRFDDFYLATDLEAIVARQSDAVKARRTSPTR